MSIRKYNVASDTLKFPFNYNSAETALLRKELKGNANVDINDLRRVSLWKLDRVLAVSDETLSCLRKVAKAEDLSVDAPISKRAIEMLVDSQGIGFPMASAMLKFLRPDVFPIIDVRAYRALTGTKPYYSTYTLTNYISYAKALADIAKRLNRPLSDVDEQLYCFDAAHNGKI
jgi:thermostable 8-oxoguanine DNA glycosylase